MTSGRDMRSLWGAPNEAEGKRGWGWPGSPGTGGGEILEMQERGRMPRMVRGTAIRQLNLGIEEEKEEFPS